MEYDRLNVTKSNFLTQIVDSGKDRGMKIITAQFDLPGQELYARLLKVFEYSAKKNMPDVSFQVLPVKPIRAIGIDQHLANNRAKMEAWSQIEITEPTILMDCDMIVLNNMIEAFNFDYDIGLTYRTCGNPPRNGGVVFLQPTDRANKFLKTWNKIDKWLYRNRVQHQIYRKKYTGMNQASLGYLLENNLIDGLVEWRFSCWEWNACNEDWPYIAGYTKAVHVKGGGQLRGAIKNNVPYEYVPEGYREVLRLWRAYECESKS